MHQKISKSKALSKTIAILNIILGSCLFIGAIILTILSWVEPDSNFDEFAFFYFLAVFLAAFISMGEIASGISLLKEKKGGLPLSIIFNAIIFSYLGKNLIHESLLLFFLFVTPFLVLTILSIIQLANRD